MIIFRRSLHYAFIAIFLVGITPFFMIFYVFVYTLQLSLQFMEWLEAAV